MADDPITKNLEVWQFIDAKGHLLLESADIAEIRRRLLDGSLPATAWCRKGKTGDCKTIAKSIARDEFRIGVLFNPVLAHVRQGAKIGGSSIGCLGLLSVLVFQIMSIKELGASGFQLIIAFAPAVVLGFFGSVLAGSAIGALMGLLVGLARFQALKNKLPSQDAVPVEVETGAGRTLTPASMDQSLASRDSDQDVIDADGEARVSCSKCGRMILRATAERTAGICIPCKKRGRR